MSRASASIHHVELGERELELSSKSIDLGLEFAFFDRSKLVEQGKNKDRVDGEEENLRKGRKTPDIEDELVSSLLDDLEATGKDRGHENAGDEGGLDLIAEEDLGSLLVEAELLLENESAVEADRQAQDLLDEHEGEDECDGVADFACEASGSPLEEQVASEGPELREDIVVNEQEVLNLRDEAADDAELGLGATVGLGLVEGFLVDFFGQDGGGLGSLKNTVLAKSQERFEDILTDGEAQNELLPGEQWAIEVASEALKRERQESARRLLRLGVPAQGSSRWTGREEGIP